MSMECSKISSLFNSATMRGYSKVSRMRKYNVLNGM